MLPGTVEAQMSTADSKKTESRLIPHVEALSIEFSGCNSEGSEKETMTCETLDPPTRALKNGFGPFSKHEHRGSTELLGPLHQTPQVRLRDSPHQSTRPGSQGTAIHLTSRLRDRCRPFPATAGGPGGSRSFSVPTAWL